MLNINLMPRTIPFTHFLSYTLKSPPSNLEMNNTNLKPFVFQIFNIFSASMNNSQRDLYAGQAKQETGKVPLNLIGGKFYQGGEKKQQSIWEKERRGKEKKSRWSNIKNTFFTPIGTQPERRKNGRHSPHKNQQVATPHYGSSPAIASGQEDTERGYHDPSISYLRPCPSYHDPRHDDPEHPYAGFNDTIPMPHNRMLPPHPSSHHLSPQPCHSSSPNLSDQAMHHSGQWSQDYQEQSGEYRDWWREYFCNNGKGNNLILQKIFRNLITS